MSARFTANYNTQDELDFVSGIGSFRIVGKKKYTKIQLLEMYKKNLEKRVNWGMIDKGIIFTAIDDEVKNINDRN